MPRKSKTSSNTSNNTTGQSELIGFSHHVPQQAFKVCLTLQHTQYHVFVSWRICSISAMSWQDDIAEDAVTGKDFFSPGEINDSEPDELETCKPV